MKIKIVAAFAGLLFLISGSPAFTAETNSVTADWKDLVTRINTKIRAEQKTEKDLADELKEFDALLVKHKGADAEDLAQILSLKAGLYLQVLDQPEKAAEVFKQIKHDFPQTKVGQHTDEILGSLGLSKGEIEDLRESGAI